MATIKEELPVLGIKASSYYIRQVAVTCRRGTSVVKNLKFFTLLPYFHNQISFLTNITVTYSSSCYW